MQIALIMHKKRPMLKASQLRVSDMFCQLCHEDLKLTMWVE